jgi:outer membrane protein assembly factor BamB
MNKKIIAIWIMSMFLLTSLTVSAVSGVGNDWPMFRYDTYNSGFSPATAPDTNNVLWIYNSQLIWNFVSSPVVSNGKVYFNGEGDDTVYCVNSENGKEIWNTPIIGSDIRASSPAVADDKIYVVSDNGYVYCLDADNGAEIWNFATDHDIHSTSPTVHDGKVYICDNRNVYCLGGDDGALHWKRYAGPQATNTVPAVAYGNVYVSTKGLLEEDGKLLCLDADTGELKWYYNASDHMYENWEHVTSPVVANNKVYICVCLSVFNSNSVEGCIYCFDAETGDKTILYTYPDEGYILSTPAIAYGNIYLTTCRTSDGYGNLLCIDAETGDAKWKSPRIITNDEGWSHAQFLVVADHKVIFHDVCYLFCVDADTGDLIWYKIPAELGWYSQMNGEPAVVDGTIFVAYGSKVCAFNDEISINMPSDPSPEDGAIDVEIDTVLSWKGGDPDEGDSVRYLIFFGKDPSDLVRIYDEIGPYPWNQTDISWDPGQLEHDTTYYWKIVPIDEQGSSKTGPTWQFTTNYAPDIPTIAGPPGGKAGKEYEYTFFTTDPTGDDICYYVDWGDGTNSGWTSFVLSGTTVTLTHTWEEKGTYTIGAKAKDIHGAESDWVTLKVSMPKSKAISRPLFLQFLQNFFEKHPNAFPILQTLLQRSRI